ncbi:hypothetical protein Bp8pS_177 [Bacillus phage vB_BpuM-BpSp]|nr:hypothetical protein Bp8pS_177 [Bacillus phage vB_BpuM-BpSp]
MSERKTIKKNVRFEGNKYPIKVTFCEGKIELISIYDKKNKAVYNIEVPENSRMYSDQNLIRRAIELHIEEKDKNYEKNKESIKRLKSWNGKL